MRKIYSTNLLLLGALLFGFLGAACWKVLEGCSAARGNESKARDGGVLVVRGIRIVNDLGEEQLFLGSKALAEFREVHETDKDKAWGVFIRRPDGKFSYLAVERGTDAMLGLVAGGEWQPSVLLAARDEGGAGVSLTSGVSKVSAAARGSGPMLTLRKQKGEYIRLSPDVITLKNKHGKVRVDGPEEEIE